VGDFRLLDKRVLAEVSKYREWHRFVRGIVAHVGFRQEALPFDRDSRYSGVTGYPLRKMLAFASDGILGFSTIPLRMISRLGFLISAISIFLAIYIFGVRIFEPERTVPGWAFLGVGMFGLSGLQFIVLGVIGSYVGRTYVESQRRPLYSIQLAARGKSATGKSATGKSANQNSGHGSPPLKAQRSETQEFAHTGNSALLGNYR
jgi:polyisoprenyl-phosphate glycosyltransferase